ncbi:GNAT family N-acetyltransferase [Roseivivax marinus]|uniref:acyl-homoserine-lactone synthase n=1 Tax=Roseivivax marinus TaxID=1379903 RepID=UPI001F03B9BE|nr:acyl-homoserine-lactone synthase [Roseivivax marinus]UMA66284.1 GNAT family N-acetyltransferase [Roseivivax marinus]
MIIVLDALNRDIFADIMRDVFALRARVFRDRLGWDVQVNEEGLEIDVFDGLDPAYVVSLDDEGRVVGTMRLLQTTGPHMMTDVFAELLDGEPALRDPQVWEATRFCIDTERLGRGAGRNTVSYVTSEIMVGAFEYAMQAGVTDAVAVIDPVMNRLMRRSGNAPYDYLGSAKPMGKVVAMAALMDASAERVASIREFAGIEGDVFGTEEEIRTMFTVTHPEVRKIATPVAPAASASDAAQNPLVALAIYCRDQLQAARTDEEREAAQALVSEIARSVPKSVWSEIRNALPEHMTA